MKALSIKDPWASLIREGKKTIETRTWYTKYRGCLLLCCSKRPSSPISSRAFIRPISPISGCAFATAVLVNCRPMVKEDGDKAMCDLYPGAYSWILEDVRPIIPFRVTGKLRLFDVDCSKGRVLYDL